nr:ABC transporter ATP-binding protein [Ardenticatena sp.]
MKRVSWSSAGTMRRLLRAIFAYPRQLVLAYGAMLTVTALNLVVPWIVRDVIDRGLLAGETRVLLISALLILLVALLRAVAGYAMMFYGQWLSFRVAYDLRQRLYEHLQRLSFDFFDRAQTGDLMSRLTGDVEQTQRFTGTGLLQLINVAVLLFGIIVVLLRANFTLALVALLPLPILVAITVRLGTRLRRMSHAVQEQLGRISSVMQESLTGIRVVKAFAREPYELQKFRQQNERFYRQRVHLVNTWANNFSFMSFLIAFSIGLVLLFGGGQVLAGSMTVGTLFAFVSYLSQLNAPVRQLGFLVARAADATASAERIFDILDTAPTIEDTPDAIEIPAMRGSVTFEHVSFAYHDGKPILHDVSFHVPPGQVVGIVGPTGSGKSTVVSLIPRFYDVSAGRVLIDGYDVRQLKLASLRRHIGMVLQDAFLFSTTVRENIAFGRPDATEDEVVAAAKAAAAHEFIMELPNGYETVLGERGVTLSGGQRQRIAIARALLQDPRILILDDSLSAVDTETEYTIRRALNRLMKGRTTFIIAQRLLAVQHADCILVFDEGRLVEQGRHDELLAQQGLYAHMYDLQLRAQEEYAALAQRQAKRRNPRDSFGRN